MDRLTAEDQRMLWPDEIWPQDIGALPILDGGSLLDATVAPDAEGTVLVAGCGRRVFIGQARIMCFSGAGGY